MTEEEQGEIAGLDPVNAKLKHLGNAFMLGMDTERHWVNGLQVFMTPDLSIIVFREQNAVEGNVNEAGDVLLKNRTSVIMPTHVAVQLRDALNTSLAAIQPPGQAGGNAA